jgi:hypothetical protein
VASGSGSSFSGLWCFLTALSSITVRYGGHIPGGFDTGFFFEMSALGLLYLGASVIIADGVLSFKDNKLD